MICSCKGACDSNKCSASKKHEFACPLVPATMQSARTMAGVTSERGEAGGISFSSILIIVTGNVIATLCIITSNVIEILTIPVMLS